MVRLPALRTCIVAEQVRPEANNRSTILGFAGLSPTVEITFSALPAPLTISFFLLMETVVDTGDYGIEFSLHSNGKPLVPRNRIPQQPEPTQGNFYNFAFNFTGLPISEVGELTLTVYSHGIVHSSHTAQMVLAPANTDQRTPAQIV